MFYIVNSCPLMVHKDSNFFTSLQPVTFWVFDYSTLVSMRCGSCFLKSILTTPGF